MVRADREQAVDRSRRWPSAATGRSTPGSARRRARLHRREQRGALGARVELGDPQRRLTAAWMSGLAMSERSISSLSGRDWNTRPPLAGNVEVLHDPLRLAAGNAGRRRGSVRLVLGEIAVGRAAGRDCVKSGPSVQAPRAKASPDDKRASEPGASVRLRHGRRAGACLAWRRENRPIAAGRTVRKSMGASSVPPTTTTASGRWTWLPIAVEKAAGSRPTQAAAQVISTGRICTAAGLGSGLPRARGRHRSADCSSSAP